jgi:hypothetical protein
MTRATSAIATFAIASPSFGGGRYPILTRSASIDDPTLEGLCTSKAARDHDSAGDRVHPSFPSAILPSGFVKIRYSGRLLLVK